MAIERFDDTEIRRAISILKPNNELFEIRIVGSNWTASGYFTDSERCIKALHEFPFRGTANVYILPNEIDPSCYQREQRDTIIAKPKNTTSDKEILSYRMILIDVDSQRISGTSSTDEQVQQSRQLANKVYVFLRDKGFSRPIAAVSGNGAHLVYRVDFPNTEENKQTVKTFLQALDMLFSTEDVKIDTTVFNPARIIKLYGTLAQKGANTKDAPHRMARIIRFDGYEPTEIELVQKVASMLPKDEKPQKYNNWQPSQFDLDSWLTQYGLDYTKEPYSDGYKYILSECPFDPNHKGKDAAIFRANSGKICFYCFHNSCAGKTWRDVRLKYQPDAYDERIVTDYRRPNATNREYRAPERISEIGKYSDADAPVWYSTKEISSLPAKKTEFIKTGITQIDKKMRGLQKGLVTCISGLRSAGKSSIVSELILNTVEQGYRVALFSGELTAKRASDWMALQAAGKNFVKPTNYENFYLVDEAARKRIDEWLDGKVFIYNNERGNQFRFILNAVEKCVSEHKVDLVVLDNMMALDLSELNRDKYECQSTFVKMLEDYAKAANIHILFVAHPRKASGFLRMDDISGSGDITNRVDNCFIVHRVNRDFIRLSSEMFKWKSENELYEADNAIEVCKDRETGVQDLFIPLYFDPTCKRLKNERAEHIAYSWQEKMGEEESDWTEVAAEQCPF